MEDTEITTEDRLYPKTIDNLIERWDLGESLFTIEMGGLGPGYEQCIHICVFELLRERTRWESIEDTKKADEEMNQVLWNNEKCKVLGLSRAQAGAAKNLAYHFLKDGYRETLKTVQNDRYIQVSKNFPG